MTTLEKDQQEIVNAHILAAYDFSAKVGFDLLYLNKQLAEFKRQIIENGSAKDLEKINEIIASITSINTDTTERFQTLVKLHTSKWYENISNLIIMFGILYLSCYGLYHMIVN